MNPNEVKKKTVVYRDKEGNVVTSKDQAWSADWTYVYADGRKQVWRTGANEDPEQTGTLQSETTDPDQQKIWEDQKKQETAKGSAAAQESISAPANQPYVMRTGPKDADHPDGIYYYPNPNFTGGDNKKGTKTTIEGDPPQVVAREIEADGSPGRIISQKPATKAEIESVQGASGTAGTKRIPVAGKPGIYQVTNDTKDPAGNTISETHFEDEAGNRVATPGAEGTTGAQRVPVADHPGIYQVTNATKDAQGNAATETHFEDEQGNRVPTPIKPEKPTTAPAGESRVQMVPDPDNPGQLIAKPIPGTDRAPGPDLGALKAELGNIVPELQDRWQKYLDYVQKSGGTYTITDAEKDLARDQQMAQARANEITSILNGQQNIRSQDITQRSQTLTDAANRQQFANNASTNALKILQDLGPAIGKSPPGSAATLVKGLMGMQADFAKGLGGFPDQTPVERTAAQQGLMNTVPSGLPAAPAAPAAQPITININGAPAGGPQGLSGLGPQLSAGLANTVAGGGAGYDPMNPAGMSGGTAEPTSPQQIVDMYRDPNDQMWNSTLDKIKAEISTPPGGAQTVGPNQRFAGGQLRAPGAGPVGAGPVSGGPVGSFG